MREKYKQELSGPIAVVTREAKTDSDHRNTGVVEHVWGGQPKG